MLPILLVLVLAMIDFGMVFNAQAVVTNAARDGARAASLGKKYAPTGALIANETGGLGDASGVSWSVCTAATIDATTWDCSSTTSGNTTTYDSKRAIDAIVKVTVSYRYTWITPLPAMFGWGRTTTVSQPSYMRIETTS